MQVNNMTFGLPGIKGTGKVNAVPVFSHQLPLTRGGIIGTLTGAQRAEFGRVVSYAPTTPNVFQLGIPSGNILAGVLIYDPTISTINPAHNNEYWEGQPCTIVFFGMIQYMLGTGIAADTGGVAGRNMYFANSGDDAGKITFAATAPGSSTQLPGFVVEDRSPNAVTVFVSSNAI